MAEYQEHSYLLDPHWETILVPAIQIFRSTIRSISRPSEKNNEALNEERFGRLIGVIYDCIKCRGYKTISESFPFSSSLNIPECSDKYSDYIARYFPHTPQDLNTILSFTSLSSYQLGQGGGQSIWTLRYIILLWLSLVVLLPFDLARFNAPATSSSIEEESVAKQIEKLGLDALPTSGLEREASALLLARLYSR